MPDGMTPENPQQPKSSIEEFRKAGPTPEQMKEWQGPIGQTPESAKAVMSGVDTLSGSLALGDGEGGGKEEQNGEEEERRSRQFYREGMTPTEILEKSHDKKQLIDAGRNL